MAQLNSTLAPANAFPGLQIETETANVLAFFCSNTAYIFVVTVPNPVTASRRAFVALVRPDCVEKLSGSLAFDRESDLLVVCFWRSRIAEAASVDSIYRFGFLVRARIAIGTAQAWDDE